MQLHTQATVTATITPAQAYALATDAASFSRYFKGCGPVPAVLKVEWEPGPQGVIGARRRVYNSDGSVIVEEVLELSASHRHRYRLISGFKPPFSWMVKWAEGDWRFTPEAKGTRIDWHYHFELRSAVVSPLVLPIVQIFFRRAMQDCLTAMVEQLTERRVPPRR